MRYKQEIKHLVNFIFRAKITNYLRTFKHKHMLANVPLYEELFLVKNLESIKSTVNRQISSEVKVPGSFNYLRLDFRSLVLKYNCIVVKKNIFFLLLYKLVFWLLWSIRFVGLCFLSCSLICMFIGAGLINFDLLQILYGSFWLIPTEFFLAEYVFRYFAFLIIFFYDWNFNLQLCCNYLSGSWWEEILRGSLELMNFFFINWEVMSSFEFFTGISGWAVTVEFWLWLVILILLIVTFFFLNWALKYCLFSVDLWEIMLNWLYKVDFGRWIPKIESLHQVYGDLYRRNGVFWELSSQSANYREVYTDFVKNQTFAGFVGFIDLFPTYSSVHNYRHFLKKFFRVDSLVNDLHLQLFQYWNLTDAKKNRFRSRLRSFDFQIKNLENSLFSRGGTPFKRIFSSIEGRPYLAPRFHVGGTTWPYFSFLNFFKNISIGGEFGVENLRRRLFLALTSKKDPWFYPDLESNLQVFQTKAAKTKINWYAKELNSVVLARTLRHKRAFFSNLSVKRFKFGWQNLVNDYSFWRTELNETGIFEHYDHSFAVPEEADYSDATSNIKIEDVLSEADTEEEDPEVYLDESAVLFYEDGLLHKSLESILFDDEVDELLSEGVSDDNFDEFEEELASFLSNQGLIYRGGQEADYGVITKSRDYATHYTLEFDSKRAYLEQIFSSFYDELADLYWISGVKNFYLNFFEYPGNRVFSVWPSKKWARGQALSKRTKMGRLLTFYRKNSFDVVIPRYDHLIYSFFYGMVTALLISCGLVFYCAGLVLEIKFYLFFELYTFLICNMVGVILFFILVTFLCFIQFFWLTTFFFFLVSFTFNHYLFLSILMYLSYWRSVTKLNINPVKNFLTSYGSGGFGRSYTVFDRCNKYGFMLFGVKSQNPAFFFFPRFLDVNARFMLYRNFQSLMLAANDIRVLKSLNQFSLYSNLVKKLSFSTIRSNNKIHGNYNFIFLHTFNLKCGESGLSTKSLGVVISTLDFYYIDKNFEDIRAKLVHNSILGWFHVGRGVSGFTVFEERGRFFHKLAFTSHVRRSLTLINKSNSNTGYANAFMFFNALDWTKSLWQTEYDFNLDRNGGGSCRDWLSSEALRVDLQSTSSEKEVKFPRQVGNLTTLKFFGVRLPNETGRLENISNLNFIRLFLANRVLSAEQADKTINAQSSVFESLFYSTLFDIRVMDKFYLKK